MDIHRSYTRHPIALRVWVKNGAHWTEATSIDASRGGVFVQTPEPAKAGLALPTRIELPTGQVVELLSRVRQSVADTEEHPLGPGMGLESFAISREARAAWEAFVASLRQRRLDPGYAENSQVLRDQLPSKAVRDTLRKMRESGELVSASLPARPTVPSMITPAVSIDPADTAPAAPPAVQPGSLRRSAHVAIHPTDRGRLQAVTDRVLRSSTLFLRTRSACEAGQPVRVVLVHPETDAELPVAATVERVVTDDDGTFAGVQARFLPMDSPARALFDAFLRGVEPTELPATWRADDA